MAISKTENNTKTHTHEVIQYDRRLPCRGCLKTCSNYTVCDGKPWRIELDQQTVVNLTEDDQ